jgi:hypothetical protein
LMTIVQKLLIPPPLRFMQHFLESLQRAQK